MLSHTFDHLQCKPPLVETCMTRGSDQLERISKICLYDERTELRNLAIAQEDRTCFIILQESIETERRHALIMSIDSKTLTGILDRGSERLCQRRLTVLFCEMHQGSRQTGYGR